MLHHAVEFGEECFLGVEILDHALDHEVALGECRQIGDRGDATEDGRRVLLGEATFLDLLGQALGHRGDHGVGGGLRAGTHDGRETGPRDHFGQTRAHDSGADDADG